MTTYCRALLTFHHILSTRKKEIIKDSARKLNLVGVCKVGYPGVLAVEGSELQVKQYIREIKVRISKSFSLTSFLIYLPSLHCNFDSLYAGNHVLQSTSPPGSRWISFACQLMDSQE